MKWRNRNDTERERISITIRAGITCQYWMWLSPALPLSPPLLTAKLLAPNIIFSTSFSLHYSFIWSPFPLSVYPLLISRLTLPSLIFPLLPSFFILSLLIFPLLRLEHIHNNGKWGTVHMWTFSYSLYYGAHRSNATTAVERVHPEEGTCQEEPSNPGNGVLLHSFTGRFMVTNLRSRIDLHP